MKATNVKINKAIKRVTGYDIKVHKSGGCCHFYSEDNETALMLSNLYSTTVYVNAISDLSVDRWVEEFKFLLKEANHNKY